jgi:protein-tyrosine phosphatase
MLLIVLVALALIEYGGMKPEETIKMIRDARPGAFNL